MSPAEELSSLYERWRRLTESEGNAIREGAWTEVEHYQYTKSRLQPRIVEVSSQLEATAHEKLFGSVVERLIQLERRNSDWLQQQHGRTDRQKQELDRTSRNLRQLHKSYVPPARAHWQSYS